MLQLLSVHYLINYLIKWDRFDFKGYIIVFEVINISKIRLLSPDALLLLKVQLEIVLLAAIKF